LKFIPNEAAYNMPLRRFSGAVVAS